MKVVVTGGAGFIGSHLVERLVAEDYEVTVLDDLSTGNPENLRPVLREIELIHGDIRHRQTVDRAVAGAAAVFHLAARGSVARSVQDPVETNDINVNGTLQVLLAARDAGVQRFLFASSSSIYGDTPTLPKHEEMPLRPMSPYGVSKQAAEMYCRVFYGVYGLPTISLRYFNVFGPRQDPQSQYAAVIPKFASELLDGRSPIVNGDGEQSRDFTFVGNVVEANILGMKASAGFGEAYNIAAGGRITVNQLAQELIRMTGENVLIQYGPSRPGDIRDSFAAIDRASEVLGYQPRTTFAEGIRQTVAWYAERFGKVRRATHQGVAGRS